MIRMEKLDHASSVETMVRMRHLGRMSRAFKDPGVQAAALALEKELTRLDTQIDDELRMGGANEEFVGRLRANAIRRTTGKKRIPGNPVLFEMPDRMHLAKTADAAKRMLQRRPEACERFVWTVVTNYESQTAEEVNPHDALTDFDLWSEFDCQQKADESEDRTERKLLLACSRAALKRFRHERIPVIIETNDNVVFFAYGGGKTSYVEDQYLRDAFAESCVLQLGSFLQLGACNGVNWGVTLRSGTTAAFARKYKL